MSKGYTLVHRDMTVASPYIEWVGDQGSFRYVAPAEIPADADFPYSLPDGSVIDKMPQRIIHAWLVKPSYGVNFDYSRHNGHNKRVCVMQLFATEDAAIRWLQDDLRVHVERTSVYASTRDASWRVWRKTKAEAQEYAALLSTVPEYLPFDIEVWEIHE